VISQRVNEFDESGGILIAPISCLQGMEFRVLSKCITYENIIDSPGKLFVSISIDNYL